MLLLLTAAAIGAVVKFGLRSLLSLFGKLILLFDPFPATPTKFLTK